MQDGMGIISYVKYYRLTGSEEALEMARIMGDYIINETLTGNYGNWPNFTRSSGVNIFFPLETSGQADLILGPNTIEPDKGGIAGYALILLYNATKDSRYLNQAIQNAKVLLENMAIGNSTHAPWPFRTNGLVWTPYKKNGNMAYILRLWDALVELGYQEYEKPAYSLWQWIKEFQIPSGDNQTENMFVGFFEDIIDLDEVDRNSWCPLELARYLIERREKLDSNWYQYAEQLIQFALKHFSQTRLTYVTVMGEQDDDHKPWFHPRGVAALFNCAGAPEWYKEMAIQNLNWVTYFIDNDGCPQDLCDGINSTPKRGGWQEDAHTDKIHNFVDAINALNGKC